VTVPKVLQDCDLKHFHFSHRNIFDFEILFLRCPLQSDLTSYCPTFLLLPIGHFDEFRIGLVLVPAVKSDAVKYFWVIANVGSIDDAVLREGILDDPKMLAKKEGTFRESVSILAADAPSL
jgi:hypothetical protein